MSHYSVPSSGRLSSALRISPLSPSVVSALKKLSRPSLISLALDWLDDHNASLAAPFLIDGSDNGDYADDFYPPASSLEDLRDTYEDLKAQKGSKRDIVDRIVEGDWRDGLTLYQLAMADLQHMRDHPTSHKWVAYKICPLQTPRSQDDVTDKPTEVDDTTMEIPRFHPSTFVRNLQAQAFSDVKAHFIIERPKGMPLLILRILVLETPYSSGASAEAAALEPTQTIYVAFPDAAPHIYISRSSHGVGGTVEANSLRKVMLQGIPKALSRSRQRYTLQSTNLTTRSLTELLERRGPGRTNSAGGGWGIYADTKKKESPLDTVQTPTPTPATDQKTQDDPRVRAKQVVRARFGLSADIHDGKGVERVDVSFEDPATSRKEDKDWRPNVRIVLQGPHVFAGVRQLVEAGVIDGERMPGWMTGQEGITLGVVSDGRIRGHGEEPVS